MGRRTELAQVSGLLEHARLVTLTGVGGVGKTRLALRAANDARAGFPDGVCLVELSSLQDPALIGHAILEALPVADQTTRPPVEVLVEWLADKHLLLVLDTCEHLVNACAWMTDTLLQAAPGLCILATSRQPLDLAGERQIAVQPLPVGNLQRGSGAERSNAVVLFTQRAAAAAPEFVLDEHNQQAVIQICRRLDGIPLAIELATAQLSELSVDELSERLHARFELLTAQSIGGKAGLARHHTLRTTIGWSHELCAPLERLLWARLSVFAGGFDAEAAERICSGGPLSAQQIPRVLTALVDKSLVRQEDQDLGPVRYCMLDTVRDYGGQWLRELSEQDQAQRRHRDWYQQLAEYTDANWFGPHQLECSHRLRSELANLRAALDFCLTTPGEALVGLHMAAVLWLCWGATGLLSEGRHWLERALALNPAPTRERITALWAAGYTAAMQGDVSGSVLLLEACQDLAWQIGDETALIHVAKNLGLATLVSGDLPRSEELLEEALQRCHALDGQDRLSAEIRNELALVCFFQGKVDRTVALCEKVRTVCEAHGDQWQLAYMYYHLGLAMWAQGELGQATAHAKDSLRIKQIFHDTVGIVLALELLAWTAAAGEEVNRGAVLFGVAAQIWSSLRCPPLFGAKHWSAPHEECMDRARQALGKSAFQDAFTRGTEVPLAQGIAYALGE